MPEERRDPRPRRSPDPDPPVEMVQPGLSAAEPVRASVSVAEQVSGPRFDMHYGLELGIVLSGRMRRYYRSWEVDLGPGEAWYCGIWERHGWAVAEAPCETVVLVMLPQMLASPEPLESVPHDWLGPFLVPPQHRPRIAPETRQHLLAVAQQIREKRTGRSPVKPMWLKLLAFEALSLLERSWRAPEGRDSLPHSYRGISHAVELVFSLRRLVTAEEAAAACAMSGRTFRRAFEALMGLSFSKFALRYRLSGVAAELTSSQQPLKLLAARWGFEDTSHLHRCFVQHYRCTPQEYRNQMAPGWTQEAPLSRGRTGGTRSERRHSGA